MVTAKQLVSEMERRGYHVTDRQIRDWRDKGLLPPLIRHGQGRGMGALFCWRNEDVIDQAITVCELLDRRARTTDAILGLWFIGYPMEPKRIRQLWLSRMERTQRAFLRGASGREAAEDALFPLSVKVAEAAATQFGLNDEELKPLVAEFIGALLNPGYSVSDDEIWELDSAATAFLSSLDKSPNTQSAITAQSLGRALDFTRRNLSLDSALRLIASATDAEFEIAHRRWRSVIRLVGILSTKACSGGISGDLAQHGRQASAIFGGFCILALLHLGHNRKGRLVDLWINRCEQEAKKLIAVK